MTRARLASSSTDVASPTVAAATDADATISWSSRSRARSKPGWIAPSASASTPTTNTVRSAPRSGTSVEPPKASPPDGLTA